MHRVRMDEVGHSYTYRVSTDARSRVCMSVQRFNAALLEPVREYIIIQQIVVVAKARGLRARSRSAYPRGAYVTSTKRIRQG